MAGRPRAAKDWQREDRRPRSQSAPGRAKLQDNRAKDIRARLRRLQRDRGYASQAEFAARAGIRDSSLKGWLAKKPRAPDIPNLLLLSHNLGVSLDWLLLGQGRPELVGADRPREELATALRSYLISAIAVRDLAKYRELIEQEILPDGAKFLQNLVDLLDVNARKRVKERSALLREISVQDQVGTAVSALPRIQAALEAPGTPDEKLERVAAALRGHAEKERERLVSEDLLRSSLLTDWDREG